MVCQKFFRYDHAPKTQILPDPPSPKGADNLTASNKELTFRPGEPMDNNKAGRRALGGGSFDLGMPVGARLMVGLMVPGFSRKEEN
jgi:hypothetical protein